MSASCVSLPEMISSLQHESRRITEAITQLRASQRLLDTRLAAAQQQGDDSGDPERTDLAARTVVIP